MYYSFKKYKIQYFSDSIEIADKQFFSYARIILLNEFDQQITSLERGIVEYDELIQELKTHKRIILDYCFVKDFDINKIKKTLNQDNLEIEELSAQHTIFESNSEINFSNLLLTQEELSFNDSYILKGKLNFHASRLASKINNFKNIVFNHGEIDFSNVTFGEKENTFKNSVFQNGFKNFQYANFSLGEANFTNVSFGNGDVSFINADFKNAKPTFKVSTFENGKVDFHYAHFGDKNISFERVNFGEGAVDFSKVELGSGKINFNRSLFSKGDINFEGIELENGKLTFKRTTFLDNYINFTEANCKGSTLLFQAAHLGISRFNFQKLTAKNISFISCHLNNYVDFRVKDVHTIDLGGTVVRDILDFIPYKNNVNIKILNLDGMRLIGKIFLDWNKNDVYNLIHRQEESSNIQKAYQFRLLKENFHNTGEYEAEDKAYIYFKRYESISILKTDLNKNIWSKLTAYPNYYFKDLLLDKAGLYATAPLRVLWSMFISYIFFSLLLITSTLMQVGNLSGSEDVSLMSIIGDDFYFSAITYLTVGYGDFCPLGINRWIAGIEGFVGVFLMAYFTVAFVRKILR